MSVRQESTAHQLALTHVWSVLQGDTPTLAQTLARCAYLENTAQLAQKVALHALPVVTQNQIPLKLAQLVPLENICRMKVPTLSTLAKIVPREKFPKKDKQIALKDKQIDKQLALRDKKRQTKTRWLIGADGRR